MAVRQSLFAAGLAAFDRQPIGLVSVLDITETADVAKGVFYLHFRSKDEYLLALWENIQRSFLDGVRAATLDCRSRAARGEAVVKRYALIARQNPAAFRFWIRMSSYFPDEVGQPGRLVGIHEALVRELAAVLTGRAEEVLTEDDLRSARLTDAICWALARSAFATREPLCDDETAARVVATALKTTNRAAAT